MSDRYLAFANSGLGKRLTGLVGLPQPSPLQRFRPEQPELARVFASAGVATIHHLADGWAELAARHNLRDRRFSAASTDRAGSLVYDATGLTEVTELRRLYRFLHDTIRNIDRDGRIVIFGLTPELANNVHTQTTQRALEGLTRSVAKEAKRNIATQLVLVAPGAEPFIDSTLRFLLSSRSAYVSGQVVRIGTTSSALPPIDWRRPQLGRRVLVTGSARGIGAAIAETFAREGGELVCLDVPQAAKPLGELADRLGGVALEIDITEPAAPSLIAKSGPYDVVVHNAGITRDRTIARMDSARWDSVIGINLEAPLLITEALRDAQAIKENGRVVCVSSIAGIAGNPGQTNYGASKAGIIGLVAALQNDRFTVNAVAPGFIETAMTAAIPFGIREAGRRLNAMGQGGLPADVAETINWLAHPASGGINGNIIRVCGQSLIGA
jgi:3-oxoacyl-[acyl-carrier protein] reductase